MSTRESFVQARDNLARAREEAKARFNEWAVLLAKEAAEDALVLVIEDEGLLVPTTEKLAPLVAAAFGDLNADDERIVHAQRIDALHDPALEVDPSKATVAEKEGGKADYVTHEQALAAIDHADALVSICEARLAEDEDA